MLDAKRFAQTAVLLFQQQHPDEMDPVRFDLKQLIDGRISLLKDMHQKQKEPSKNSFEHEVKRTATSSKNWTGTTELIWKTAGVREDLEANIKEILSKDKEVDKIVPIEIDFMTPNLSLAPWRLNRQEYCNFWIEQLDDEINMQKKDEKNISLMGQCDSEVSKDGFLSVLVPEDLILRCAWDKNDAIEISTKGFDKIKAYIRSIEWPDEVDQLQGCCKLNLHLQGTNQQQTWLSKDQKVELMKPQTMIALQRWRTCVLSIIDDQICNVGKVIWDGKFPDTIRSNQDLAMVKNCIESPSSSEHEKLAQLNENQRNECTVR